LSIALSTTTRRLKSASKPGSRVLRRASSSLRRRFDALDQRRERGGARVSAPTGDDEARRDRRHLFHFNQLFARSVPPEDTSRRSHRRGRQRASSIEP